MERKVNKEKVTTRKVTVGITCDNCKADILTEQMDRDEEILYYQVYAGHNDWGTDSVDSHTNYHLCSRKCLLDHVGAYYADADGSEFYEIDRVKERAKHIRS